MQDLLLVSAGVAVVGWFAARVLVAARPRGAFARLAPQLDRYASALALCLLLAAAGLYIVRQDGFAAMPIELKQLLIPVVAPFAIGAIAAPIAGRGEAIALTLIAFAAVATILAGAGYLDPVTQNPAAVAMHWIELMRAEDAMARIWWMLLPLIALLTWTVAVFVGCRESQTGVLLPGALAAACTTTYVPAPDPWLRPPAPRDEERETAKTLEAV